MAGIERKSVHIKGLEVSYLQKASSSPEVTIVFIHGFPFSSAIWMEQLKALPGHAQGIAYDIRGFGNSATGHPYFSIDLFARDLISFLQAFSLQKVVLCGISMGGYIALRAAELEPALLAGLILCDTNSAADPDQGKLKRFAAIDQVVQEGRETFADHFVKNLFSEKTTATKPSVTRFIHQIILKTPVETICATQLALASRTDTSRVLKELDIPVLVIRGADDPLMTAEQAGQLKKIARNAELEEIEDAGHLPNNETPEAFNARLTGFLEKHFAH